MNMLTRVENLITPNFNEINEKIEEMQKGGWYLRGTPQFLIHEKNCVAFMTFEKETPATGVSKTEQREPDVPPPTDEEISRLLHKGKASDK